MRLTQRWILVIAPSNSRTAEQQNSGALSHGKGNVFVPEVFSTESRKKEIKIESHPFPARNIP